MKLSKDLKLVFQIETEAHGVVHVYVSPISREVFETYYAELGAVFSQCFRNGDAQHLLVSGPKIAYAALRKAAMTDGTWDPKTGVGVKDGLVNEIVRLTQIAHGSPAGWQTIPMASAIERGVLDDDASAEVLSTMVFFSAAFRVGPPMLMEELFPILAESRGWVFSSSMNSVSAFTASLPKSMPDETSTMDPPSVIVS